MYHVYISSVFAMVGSNELDHGTLGHTNGSAESTMALPIKVSLKSHPYMAGMISLCETWGTPPLSATVPL